MKASQLVVLLGISTVVAGCVGPVKDTFEDRAVDYKSSYSLDPIQFQSNTIWHRHWKPFLSRALTKR